MFSLLVSGNRSAWETDQLMRMDKGRFKEYSDSEAESVSLDDPQSLQLVEHALALLMDEPGGTEPHADVVRVGNVHDIVLSGPDLMFRFVEHGRLTRIIIEEFADRLRRVQDLPLWPVGLKADASMSFLRALMTPRWKGCDRRQGTLTCGECRLLSWRI